jgi:putative protease
MNNSDMKNNQVEVLAPAGTLEKLKFTVQYGADAVFFGGNQFNLRDKAGNFSLSEIAEALEYCQEYEVKPIFLLNSFLHEEDITNAKKYLNEIKKFSFYAVVVSDPGMIQLVRDTGLDCRIHLSTQMSTLNHLSINFWQELGIDRIVLAREVSLDDIKKIREYSNIELEVFMHGALCISYSGRCLLSRYLAGRDANQGACAHPCRWKFSLVEEKRPGHHLDFIEHTSGTEILASKDLCLLEQIPEYIKAGVNAFKLEGRMKSVYYASNLTRIYKHAVETASDENEFKKHLPYWKEELDLINHRPYTDDLFNEFNDMGFQAIPYIKRAAFIGTYVEKGENENEAYIKIYNPIRLNDKLEAIFPIKDDKVLDKELKVIEIYENDREEEIARPNRVCKVVFDQPIYKNAIFRKKL